MIRVNSGGNGRREKGFFFHLKAFQADEIPRAKAERCEIAC